MDNREKRQEQEAGKTDYEGKFGYFGITPRWLQWLNNPWWFLVGIVGLTIGQSLAVLGILATVMPHIEKRFNFSSFDAGMIAAANDVPAVLLGIIVAHYGNFGNKTKWIGFGGLITALGFFIFTLPHYIIESYEPPGLSLPDIMCKAPAPPTTAPPANASEVSGGCDEGTIADWYYLALLLIGQFVAGVGTIPLFAFPPACFRESVREKNIPIFLGLWQAGVFVGPFIAFGLSEPILEFYVDIDQPKGFEMTPKDPRWIANWWVGFLGSAGVSFLSAIFILGFPSRVKGQKDLEAEQSEAQPSVELTAKEKLAGVPAALRNTLTNWTFIFNSLALNVVLLFGEGLAPFVAKILILRFGVAAEKVGSALTIAGVPPLVIGIPAGAFLSRAFKIEQSGKRSAFFCFLFQFLTICAFGAFFLPGCENVNLAGLNEPYGMRIGTGRNSSFKEYPAIPGVELGSTCNANCSCNLGLALPVCGSDNTSYLSPCYAGCSAVLDKKGTKFGNCSCIASDDGLGGTVEIGYCDGNCKNWIWFLILISMVSLAVFLQVSPAKVVLMRCIPPEQISFAFGLQYLSTKIMAHIPGPILFGHVVDLNCRIWQKVCEERGFCWVYDMDAMLNMVATMVGVLSALGLLFYFLSWVLYKEAVPPAEKPNIQFDNRGFEKDASVKAMQDTRM